MKKCPFCKADIEDNARFCLYCMKSLNKKEVIPPPQRKTQWWPLAVAALLLSVLMTAILLITRENKNLSAEATGQESSYIGRTTEQAEESTDGATQDTQGNDALQTAPSTEIPGTNQKPTQNQNTTQEPAENTTPETKPTQPEPTTQTTPPTTSPTTPQETVQPEEPTEPEEPTAPETPKPQVVYTYRTARAGDDFYALYENTGNDIVITGISQPSADGTYDIPSYIDGKKVIAIVANAFFGSNARVIYVPTTIRSIWNYAFNQCPVTDIYFTHNIYIEGFAFWENPEALTFHCPEDCQDRNLRYYRNSAVYYDATWEEWNG